MGKKLECVTDRHNAMSMAEREAELMAAIGRLPGGRPEHLRRLAECIRGVMELPYHERRGQGTFDLFRDYERQVRFHAKYALEERRGLLRDLPALATIAKASGAFIPSSSATWLRAADGLESLALQLENPRWSKAMSKTRMARLVGLSMDQLNRLHGDKIKDETRKLHRIDLDRLDAAEREAIAAAPEKPKEKPRGRSADCQ